MVGMSIRPFGRLSRLWRLLSISSEQLILHVDQKYSARAVLLTSVVHMMLYFRLHIFSLGHLLSWLASGMIHAVDHGVGHSKYYSSDRSGNPLNWSPLQGAHFTSRHSWFWAGGNLSESGRHTPELLCHLFRSFTCSFTISCARSMHRQFDEKTRTLVGWLLLIKTSRYMSYDRNVSCRDGSIDCKHYWSKLVSL